MFVQIQVYIVRHEEVEVTVAIVVNEATTRAIAHAADRKLGLFRHIFKMTVPTVSI